MGNEQQSIQLFDNCLFPKVFQSFRMAIQPSKLIIAFAAMATICLAGWIMDFSKTVVTAKDAHGRTTELQIYMASPDRLKPYIENYEKTGERTGVFSELWKFTASRFQSAVDSMFAFNLPAVAANIADCFKALSWAIKHHMIYCAVFFAIKLAVISIAGGALCRMAALQCARGEKPGLTDALRYSTKKFTSFFTTPLAPIGIIIFIGLFVFLLGLVGNIPRVGELIMGLCMPLALFAGALIAVVLIGTVAGFNLMFPAVAYDGSDCFDAISRSFSYIYAKPWHMGFYAAIAAVYGAICYTFVRFCVFLLLVMTRWFLQLGVFTDSSTNVDKVTALWPQISFMNLLQLPSLAGASRLLLVAAVLVYLSSLVVVALVGAFVISFYFSANTIIYSLMRSKIDNTAIDDIYTDYTKAPEPTAGKTASEELTNSD
ncbi:MAG: hypothetical protein MUO27_06595 [Sedimentisphaerales bacterium]|nr:hypothetical protein [Sedimentisphaerales bacterium]